MGPQQAKSATCVERQNGTILLEEVREEDDLLFGQELKLCPECSGEIQCPCCGQARPLILSERVGVDNGFTDVHRDLFALKRVAR